MIKQKKNKWKISIQISDELLTRLNWLICIEKKTVKNTLVIYCWLWSNVDRSLLNIVFGFLIWMCIAHTCEIHCIWLKPKLHIWLIAYNQFNTAVRNRGTESFFKETLHIYIPHIRPPTLRYGNFDLNLNKIDVKIEHSYSTKYKAEIAAT